MRAYPFKQVDVFTTRPCAGNPVAVVLAADGLDAAEMQQLARWTNLSETTFVLPSTSPEADYRLRIFSPGHELPFAGHPTVGSAHAALEASVVSGPSFRQECGAGVLPLTVTDSETGRRISVAAPEAKLVRDCSDLADAVSASLGAQIVPEPSPWSRSPTSTGSTSAPCLTRTPTPSPTNPNPSPSTKRSSTSQMPWLKAAPAFQPIVIVV